jgi:hypothetical protein
MYVIGHDGYLVNCKAVFLRYSQPVTAQGSSKLRTEHATPVAGRND